MSDDETRRLREAEKSLRELAESYKELEAERDQLRRLRSIAEEEWDKERDEVVRCRAENERLRALAQNDVGELIGEVANLKAERDRLRAVVEAVRQAMFTDLDGDELVRLVRKNVDSRDRLVRDRVRLRAVVEAAKALDPTCLTHGDNCAAMVKAARCSCGLDDFTAALDVSGDMGGNDAEDDVIDWRRINQEEWDKPPTRVLTDDQARAELGIPPEDDTPQLRNPFDFDSGTIPDPDPQSRNPIEPGPQ